jgi:alanine-glyoxylate transaminase/serine-glyoxylate transaminase/serine-pyruvate transaminase
MLGMSTNFAPLDPPDRMLCGPGPIDVEPEALQAMQRPMVSHLDPDMHEILLDLVDRLRAVYRASEAPVVLPLQATGTSGMEAGLANLLEPGDTVIVGASGYFGFRISEMARRYTDNVVDVRADWGEGVSNEDLLAALDQHPDARMLAVVHAETSTGVAHPLAELGEAMRGRDTLLMADVVTSLGGMEVDFDGWGLDYAYSCTQKCLGVPPGMSPIAVSQRAMDRFHARKRPGPYSFDFDMLQDYWVKRPVVYHHTAPILHIYSLYEALRVVLEEGLEQRWARHARVGEYLQREVRSRDLELLADPSRQLAQLTAIRIPEGVDGKAVQMHLLRENNIEIGGGLGPQAPPMWRIGLMGYNAREEIADRVLAAFDEARAAQPALTQTG